MISFFRATEICNRFHSIMLTKEELLRQKEERK